VKARLACIEVETVERDRSSLPGDLITMRAGCARRFEGSP